MADSVDPLGYLKKHRAACRDLFHSSFFFSLHFPSFLTSFRFSSRAFGSIASRKRARIDRWVNRQPTISKYLRVPPHT